MGRSVEIAGSTKTSTIYYAGDSTVQFNCIDTYPQTGLGQVLQRFIKDEFTVENHGKNGRSTKSFIDEGRLEVISNRIGKGDFLFIQFGHNDEKKQDPSRYTKAYGEYQDNLDKFINLAFSKDAYPVLITPLERCWFEAGKVYKGEHEEYVNAMLEVAEKYNIPCINLNKKSREILDSMGEDEAQKCFMPDRTHMTMEGAIKFCYIIANSLIDFGGIYKDLVIDELY